MSAPTQAPRLVPTDAWDARPVDAALVSLAASINAMVDVVRFTRSGWPESGVPVTGGDYAGAISAPQMSASGGALLSVQARPDALTLGPVRAVPLSPGLPAAVGALDATSAEGAEALRVAFNRLLAELRAAGVLAVTS